MNDYNVIDYINSRQAAQGMSDESEDYKSFYELCAKVKSSFYADWDKSDNSAGSLEIQKRAIIGYEKEKNFFKSRINEIVNSLGLGSTVYPTWYESLVDGVYHENWGFAGLAEWFSKEHSTSGSAKIVGDRIYFLQDGHMVKKTQTMTEERKQQLVRALLLLTPQARMDSSYYETYLLDGTRVTVFLEPMAKKNCSSLIFRRYIVPSLTFEEQADRGTIPYAAIPLFESMVKVGFNVAFLGAVRTAKTTFLSTWQSYEDPSLEGVMVETDPEIPIEKILPNAPVIQLIADGDDLKRISKNLLRSDADYFILAEARDGIALDTAVRIATKGTKRMKITFHSRDASRFPLEAATEIIKQTGGDLKLTMQMVASSFDYLFLFIQLSDKSQKRLKGIYQMSCDSAGNIYTEPICEYSPDSDSWKFRYAMAADKISYGKESDAAAFSKMDEMLKDLSKAKEIFNVSAFY